ncbi:Type IV pilus biogenesis factor PilY1 [Halioglobus japonicus]|nr:Type IV pilus biogenesis factor PilY1 [Halioglobus japonicus]
MHSTVGKLLNLAPCLVVLALMGVMFPSVADDTEIYQAEYDASSSGARAKVLIVFDDSGSMSTMVEQQRPDYDPDETYTVNFPADRIYWSTNGNTPSVNSSDYFTESKNRCASSYDSLEDSGRFTAERARRWVDSTVQQGQCSYQCPAGTEYRNYPGWQNDGCYEWTTTNIPVTKLVYAQNDYNNRCSNNLIYVEYNGGDACYEEVASSDYLGGWVYRSNDSGNRCWGGTSYLYVDPPGGNNAYDACFEYVNAPEFTQETDWQWYGPREQVCEDDTDVPGSWQSLSSSVHSPTHVECRDDVTNSIDDNGSGQGSGYPQNNVLSGDEYGSNPDATVEWGGSPYTFYTSHYLNWYHDDSLVEARSRLDIAQEVISTIIATNTSIDFGLMEFNYDEGGRVVNRIIPDMSALQRTSLISKVNLMDHSGSTPMCESMYEAYNYLAGRSVEYGNSAKSGSDSNGVYDVLSKDSLAESGGKYITPNTECAYTYVILMTDGYPQRDTGANQRIKDITGRSCESYLDADGNTTENCLPQLTEYMANNDLAPNTDGDQFGVTYTIGFTTDQQLLKDAAENGKGEYYKADNAQQLTEAFQGAIVGILSEATTFTSPAVAVDTFTRTQSRDEVYYAMFKPGSSVDWIGNIKKLKLDDDAVLIDSGSKPALDPITGDIKSSAMTFWSTGVDGADVDKGGVGALLAARDPATRDLYSNTGTNSALEAFNTSNFDASALGLPSNTALYSLLGASTQSAFNKQIAWAQGFDAYDKDGDSVTNEPRSWILGDILHSQPLVLNYGALGSATEEDPDLRLLVGSNAGFVHMFGNDDGEEDWAFFPKELAEILPQRRRDATSSDNIYGMDLTPIAYTYDSNNDGTLDSTEGDKVWVYLGMRRGGDAYYALDISDPDDPEFMWRIDSNTAGFSELGQTWSQPVPTTIPGYKDNNGVRKPVLIFGAGYDTNKDASGVGASDQSGRGVFIVDAETGALIWSVTPAANSATNLSEPGLLHSVPGGVTALDSNGDEMTDRIYFGDTGGNIWRVDMPGSSLPTASQETWQINKLADFNSGTAATDRRFFSAPDVVRIRLGGVAVDAVMIGSGDRTNPNATDVENQMYMIKDLAVSAYTTERPNSSTCALPQTADFRCSLPLAADDLYDITDNAIVTGTDEEKTVAINALNIASGWRYQFTNNGEKSLAKTVTINGKVYVPTFTPSSLFNDINACEPQSGTGQMYVFDLYTGDRSAINLGSIIPNAVSLHFSEGGAIHVLLPPGAPASTIGHPGKVECAGGVCDINESMRAPYGNFWYQEEY